MDDRNVVVRDSDSSVATFGIIAVIIVAALVALFVWQPWNTTSQTTNHTTINQTVPAPAGGDNTSGTTSGTSGGTTSGSSSTTTTH